MRFLDRRRLPRLKAFTIRKPDGGPVFSSYSIRSKWFSFGIHVFDDGDADGCFHSHPAWAFRLVLWGGYVEETFKAVNDQMSWHGYVEKRKRVWFPGRFGIVKPSFEHRIDRLLFKRSVSLWVRGPLVADIETHGC